LWITIVSGAGGGGTISKKGMRVTTKKIMRRLGAKNKGVVIPTPDKNCSEVRKGLGRATSRGD